MARGKKTPEVKREQVKALLYLNPNATDAEIAKATKLPNSTVHYIKKDVMGTDEFEEVRRIKKEEFIGQAWETVQKALKLADKRFTKALEDEDAIEQLIDVVATDGELKPPEKRALYSRLKDLQMTSIRDIAIALGTIYDKQALASGEPTTITERAEPTPEIVKDMAAKLEKMKELIKRAN
jgi:hypothetical protein